MPSQSPQSASGTSARSSVSSGCSGIFEVPQDASPEALRLWAMVLSFQAMLGGSDDEGESLGASGSWTTTDGSEGAGGEGHSSDDFEETERRHEVDSQASSGLSRDIRQGVGLEGLSPGFIDEPAVTQIPGGKFHISIREPDEKQEVKLVVKGPSSFLVVPEPGNEGDMVDLICVRLATISPGMGETAEEWESVLNTGYKVRTEALLARVQDAYRQEIQKAVDNQVELWARERGIEEKLSWCF